MVVTARTGDLRGMAVLLLLLTSPPRTLRAVGGGSAAGPSHSRHFVAAQQLRRFGSKADIDFGARHANSSAPLSVNFRYVPLSCRHSHPSAIARSIPVRQ